LPGHRLSTAKRGLGLRQSLLSAHSYIPALRGSRLIPAARALHQRDH
jgi:hypothetical protein